MMVNLALISGRAVMEHIGSTTRSLNTLDLPTLFRFTSDTTLANQNSTD